MAGGGPVRRHEGASAAARSTRPSANHHSDFDGSKLQAASEVFQGKAQCGPDSACSGSWGAISLTQADMLCGDLSRWIPSNHPILACGDLPRLHHYARTLTRLKWRVKSS